MRGVLSQIKESVDKVPTSLALTLGDTHWSYQALWNRSIAIKLQLQQIASKIGAIGIYTDNTPDMYAAIIGC